MKKEGTGITVSRPCLEERILNAIRTAVEPLEKKLDALKKREPVPQCPHDELMTMCTICGEIVGDKPAHVWDYPGE